MISQTVFPGDLITADGHNALLEDIGSLSVRQNRPPRPPRPQTHAWQCSVGAGATQGDCRVFIRTGLINDNEPTIAYLTEHDDRGWVMPKDYPKTRISNGIAERSLREPLDPPYLLVSSDQDFVAVPDASRPLTFQTTEAWAKDLLSCSITLSARKVSIINNRIVPTQYRLWAGQMPSTPTYPYGERDLARLYLLQGKKPEDQQLFIHQLEFHDLMSAPVDPVTLLPDYQPLDLADLGAGAFLGLGLVAGAVSGINIVEQELTNQVNQALMNLQTSASSVEFWTV